MSSPSEINGLTPAEIFRNGTRKRLRPFTGIGVMEMLRAIGHTHKSYTEWCEGISDFKYETIRRIDRFFADRGMPGFARSEEHTSELQSLMRISYAVFCLKKKITERI